MTKSRSGPTLAATWKKSACQHRGFRAAGALFKRDQRRLARSRVSESAVSFLMQTAFDVIVVGTGAGGGTLGYALAQSGKKVLFLERGDVLAPSTLTRDDHCMLVKRIASYPEPIHSDEGVAKPLLGGVLGGSTSLYGAALLRAAPSDFTPGRFFSSYLDKSQWDWPIAYAEMAPFYAAAERLYAVCGDGSAFPFEETGDVPGYTAPPVPWSGEAANLAELLRSRGLNPFRLPLALDPNTCLGCPRCPGYVCPNGARHGAADRCVRPAVERHGARLYLGTEIKGVKLTGQTVKSILIKKHDGKECELRTEVLVIAAGAVGTPDLLARLDLARDHPALGRYYMLHLGVLFALVLPWAKRLHDEPHKQLGLTDWYTEGGDKLGYVQQLPPPRPEVLRHELALPLPAAWLDPVYQRLLLLVGSIDDIPQASNRIYRDNSGRLRFEHRYHADDVRRANILRRLFLRAVPASLKRLVVSKIPSRTNLRLAHQVGTCRFGDDPATSVVNRNCRVHNLDNVYVVDGSILPSALGVGPALTIIANAMRVAEIINREH